MSRHAVAIRAIVSRRRLSTGLTKLSWAANAIRRAENWPTVGAKTVLAWLGRSGGTFIVRTRSGVTVEAPGHDQARTPLIEVLAQDVYQLDRAQLDPAVAYEVLDVGAHVGAFTCLLASMLPRSRFTCVEPSSTSIKWLSRNLQFNHIAGRVSVVHAAVDIDDGMAPFWEPAASSSLASLASAPGETSTLVRTCSFDSLVHGLGDGPLIVKMDCEGGEYGAILRSKPESWSTVHWLFLEYHPNSTSDCPAPGFDGIADHLQDLGLAIVWNDSDRTTPGLGLACFTRHHERVDPMKSQRPNTPR